MIRKIFSLSKTILILVLAVVAVYQVSELWLVALTNRNFFLYIEARFPAAVPDGQDAWIMPRRIISGGGDRRYMIRYSGIEYSAEWTFARSALARILAGGEQVGILDYPGANWAYSNRPHMIFEYSIPIYIETFANALGQRRSRATAGTTLTSFDSVMLVMPESGEREWITAIFRAGASEWRIVLNLGTIRNPVQDFLFDMPEIDPDALYFVRAQDGFSPMIPEGFTYNTVYSHNPFQNAYGLLHLSTIRPRIEHFFDNPATIIPGPSREIYTFSNINVMVRYFQYDVLEYTSFRPIGRTAPANLVSDFSAALAFLRYDPYVVNETYLSSYEASGGEHIFRFGFVINNFPMVMEERWYAEPRCRDPLIAPVEITVSHGRVIRYRRIAFSYSVSDDVSYFDITDIVPRGLGFPISSESVIYLERF